MAKPRTIDEYLEHVPEPHRALLERVRGTIRRAAPDAAEAISYDMPTFRQDGRFLVSFAAFKNHCSLFPASDGVRELGNEVEPFLSGRGTLRFTVDRPIPTDLLRRIVKVRLEEHAAAAGR